MPTIPLKFIQWIAWSLWKESQSWFMSGLSKQELFALCRAFWQENVMERDESSRYQVVPWWLPSSGEQTHKDRIKPLLGSEAGSLATCIDGSQETQSAMDSRTAALLEERWTPQSAHVWLSLGDEAVLLVLRSHDFGKSFFHTQHGNAGAWVLIPAFLHHPAHLMKHLQGTTTQSQLQGM